MLKPLLTALVLCVTTINVAIGITAINLYPNGGTGSTITLPPPSTAAQNYTLPLNTFSRKDYRFKCWCHGNADTCENSDKCNYSDGETIYLYSGSGTYALYAQWSLGDTIFNFYPNGGTGAPNSVIVNAGEYTLPTSSFFRDGYRFNCWATSASGPCVYNDGETITVLANEDTDLYAQWEQDGAIINFYPNGGTGTMTSVYNLAAGTYQLKNNTYTKTNYYFKCWATSANGECVYSDTEAIAVEENEIVRLYAQWESRPAGTIINFKNNGGTGSMASIPGVAAGTTLSLPTNTLSNPGYDFKCWAKSANGACEYNDGAEMTVATTGLTINLYAQWWIPDGAAIYFVSNSPTGTTMYYSTYYVADLDAGSYWLPANRFFINSGYRFKCWATSVNGECIYYDEEQITVTENEVVILYAQWERDGAIINFYANGGTGTTSSMTGLAAGTHQLKYNNYTKANHYFKCWATSVDGECAYNDGEPITVAGNEIINLYAQWEAKPTGAIVYFKNNGGTGTMAPMDSLSAGTHRLDYNQFSKSGYSFKCWSTSSSYGTCKYYDGDEITVTENQEVKLYAYWDLAGATVNFKGGENVSGVMPPMTFSTAGTYSLDYNRFTKSGYHFKCWTTAYNGNGECVYYDGGDITVVNNQTITLYVKWEINNTTVTFNGNGGDGTMNSMTHLAAGTYDLPTNKFTKDGYRFVCWTTWSNGNCVYADGGQITVADNQEINLYAKWEPDGAIIKFDNNYGMGTMEPMMHKPAGTYILPANKFTKDGYHFKCWITSRYHNNCDYYDGDEIIVTENQEVILYAKWEQNGVTVTFNKNNSGASGTMEPMNTPTTGNYTLPLNQFAHSNTNLRFKCWATSSSGNCQYYDGGTIYVSSNKSLYAVWTSDPVVYFYKNADDAKGNTPTMAGAGTRALNKNQFTRSGYRFACWTTSANGNLCEYYDEEQITVTAGQEVKLYAQWTQGNIITLGDSGPKLYTKFGEGVYLDANGTQLMTQTSNPINVPAEIEASVDVAFAKSEVVDELISYHSSNGYSTGWDNYNWPYYGTCAMPEAHASWECKVYGVEHADYLNFGGYYTGGDLYDIVPNQAIDENGFITQIGINSGKTTTKDITWYPLLPQTFVPSFTLESKPGYTFDGWYLGMATLNEAQTHLSYLYRTWDTDVELDVELLDGARYSEEGLGITVYAQWTGNTIDLNWDNGGHNNAKTNVPSEYTVLDYIEANGSQAIDTGISGATTWNLVASATLGNPDGNILVSDDSDRAWFGTYSNYNFGLWSVAADYNDAEDVVNSNCTGVQECFLEYVFPGYSTLAIRNAPFVDAPINKKSNIIINFENNRNYGMVDDKPFQSSGFSTGFSGTYKLFGVGSYPSFKGKLYSAEAIQNGRLVFNGIPAKRNSDGAIGMYDTVTNTFFTNSGTGSFTAGNEVNTKAPDSCVYGTKFTMPTALMDSGYTFAGWKINNTNITKDANTVEVSCDYDTLGVDSGSATITAQWTTDTFDVYFDKNGGTGQCGDVGNKITCTYNETCTIPSGENCNIVNDSKILTGWNTSADGSGTAYNVGATITNIVDSGSVTLYAQWAATHTITLNGSDKKLYTTFGQGVYLDTDRNRSMTSNSNPIDLPTQTPTYDLLFFDEKAVDAVRHSDFAVLSILDDYDFVHYPSYPDDYCTQPYAYDTSSPDYDESEANVCKGHRLYLFQPEGYEFNMLGRVPYAQYVFGGYDNGSHTTPLLINENGYITDNGLSVGKSLNADTTWYPRWTPERKTVSSFINLEPRNGYTFDGWYIMTPRFGNELISNGTRLWKVTVNDVSHFPFNPNIQVLRSFVAQWTGNIINLNWNTNGHNNAKTNVPSEYTVLDYIESNGSQIIDTNIYGAATWELTADSVANNTGSNSYLIANGAEGATWFGVWYDVWGVGEMDDCVDSDANQCSFDPGDFENIYEDLYSGHYIGTSNNYYVDGSVTDKANIIVNFAETNVSGFVNNRSFYGENVKHHMDYSRTIVVPNTFENSYKLFGYGTDHFFKGKLYSAKATQDGQLVFNGIPVKRTVDGVETVGLYDTVSGQFFGNSGTGSFTAGNEVNTKVPDSCVYGTKFTMPAALVDSGYTFAGWKVNGVTKDANTVEIPCTVDTLGVYSGPVTITAQWTTDTYTITLNKNGGTGGTDAIKEVYDVKWTTAGNEPETILAVPELPTKDGNVFTGYWEGDTLRIPVNGSLLDSETLTTTTFTADTTLTAGWTDCKPEGYLDTIGAADKHIADVSVNVSQDNQCVYTVTCAEGYEASGTITTNTTAAADDFATVCSVVVNTYTVTFDKNADDAIGSKDDLVCNVGTDCDITNNTNDITRLDYEFLGWTTDQDSKTPEYKVTEESDGKIYINKNDTDDVELFAVWNPVCLSNKYLRISTDEEDKMCLYENRHDTSHPALAIRLVTDSETKTYYIDMSDAESNRSINSESSKKLHIMYNNKQYNVYDLTALE